MYKVLIIEENKEISNRLIKLIDWEEHGFQILGVVSNGILGRAVMERQKPDIVLLSMSTMYLGGRGFIEAVENISYPFRVIQFYTKRSTLVDSDYSVNACITLSRLNLNSQSLIRALRSASADLTRDKEDNYNLEVHQPLSTQRNNAILKILKGTTQGKYLKLAKQFQFNLGNAQLGVIILYPLENRCFEKKLIKQLSNIIKAILSQHDGGEVFVTEKRRLGAIVKFEKSGEKYTQYVFFSFIAEKLCEAIKNQIGIDVDCVMSDNACDILHVNKTYKETQEIEPYRYFKPDTRVLTRKYITSNATNISFDEIDNCLQKLYDAMYNLDSEQLKINITQLYLSLIKSSMDMAVVEYTRERLSFICNLCLSKFSLNTYKGIINIGLEQFFTVEQEYFKMKSVFFSLIEKASEKRENLNPIIRKSTNYIDQNFADEITLESAAKHVNVSTVYLSRLFRRELKTTFVTYLTRVRVENAKRLMSLCNNRISDIAKSVGYNDEKYFSRVFKKITGMSPSAYKKTETLQIGNKME